MKSYVRRQWAGLWVGLGVMVVVGGLALLTESWTEAIIVIAGSTLAIALIVSTFSRVRKRELQLAEELRQAQKMEAIGRLAGGIAHDFNNLLSVILGYTEMLGEDTTDPALLAGIDEIHEAGTRAAELTRQLLAFSRRQLLAPRVVDLGAVLANMDKLLRRLCGEDIELRVTSSSARVEVDPGQMEQVIMNLVVNARDAMPAGGSISIEVGTIGREVRLAIRDTGTGMDDATKERIFEPFFTTKESGTGLGLATVFGIIQQSDGAIAVTSAPGGGTTFEIYLPATTRELYCAPSPAPLAQLGNETVLLVEDEVPVRRVAHGILRRAGYTVIDACNGEDALAQLRRHHVDLVVTDVIMPKMGGRELAGRIAQPVLFMSGYTDEAPDGPFLQKPITPNALRAKVRELITSSRTA